MVTTLIPYCRDTALTKLFDDGTTLALKLNDTAGATKLRDADDVTLEELRHPLLFQGSPDDLTNASYASADEIDGLANATTNVTLEHSPSELRVSQVDDDLQSLATIIDSISTVLFNTNAIGFNAPVDELMSLNIVDNDGKGSFRQEHGNFIEWLGRFANREQEDGAVNFLHTFSNLTIDLLERLCELKQIEWMRKNVFVFNNLPKLVFKDGVPEALLGLREVYTKVYDTMHPLMDKVYSNIRERATDLYSQLTGTIREAIDQGGESVMRDLRHALNAKHEFFSEQSDESALHNLSAIRASLKIEEA